MYWSLEVRLFPLNCSHILIRGQRTTGSEYSIFSLYWTPISSLWRIFCFMFELLSVRTFLNTICLPGMHFQLSSILSVYELMDVLCYNLCLCCFYLCIYICLSLTLLLMFPLLVCAVCTINHKTFLLISLLNLIFT